MRLPPKIPILAERRQYLGTDWGRFDVSELMVSMDGRLCPLREMDVDFRFAPPPGWIGHIERTGPSAWTA